MAFPWRTKLAAPLAFLLLAQCGGSSDAPATEGDAGSKDGRDFARYPTVLDLAAVPTLYAVSDIHGGYGRLITLLSQNGVIAREPAAPEAVEWAAGGAALVVAGDLFNKGPQGLQVLALVQALTLRAAEAGGRVIFLMGNHEAEFLADPENDKASAIDGVDQEIRTLGLTPAQVASEMDARGAWLRQQPFALRMGGWFFCHAGDTQGRSMAELEATLQKALRQNSYRDVEIIGDDSILESREWYTDHPNRPAKYAAALGVKHIVFGHQPDGLGPAGAIASGYSGALFRIDCGMSPQIDDSKGCLLRVKHSAGEDVAESLDQKGRVTELWRGPN
jgi:hypothetical protein